MTPRAKEILESVDFVASEDTRVGGKLLMLLGIKKPVIKAHGSSDALAFRNAVKQAADAAKNNFAGELEQTLHEIAAAKAKEIAHD